MVSRHQRRRKRSTAVEQPHAARPPASATVPPRARSLGLRRLAPLLVLIALTLVAYAQVADAGFVWDDDGYITRNHHLETGAGLYAMWFQLGSTTIYAPAFFTTLWIEYQLWGLDATGYHLVNLAFHLACIPLLWQVLRRLGIGGAWLAAALFAVHPVMVESVAWVAELKNVQSAFFLLLTLLAYLRFDPLGAPEAPNPPKRWLFYGLALLCFVVALLSKPMAVTLPPAILVLVWWRRGRVRVLDLLAIAPFLAMSLATGLLAVHVENRFGVATGAGFQLSLFERLSVASRALWFYAAKLAWPVDLLSVYPRWRLSPPEWWHLLFPLSLVVLIAALWLWRRRIGRGPLAAVLCFGALVAPLTGIFNVAYHAYSYVADHFQYYAAPALFALFASGVAGLRSRSRVPIRRALDGACWALVVLLAVLTWRHVPTFHDEKTRCLRTIAGNPGAWSAMYNLGVQLKAEGDPREALRWYREALKVTPENPEVLNNAGVALMSLGDAGAAIHHYREALRIWPGYALAHNNLATALASLGDREAAMQEYSEALRIKPDYAEARANLAQLYAAERPEDALREYGIALRLRPDDADLHHGLGSALAKARRFEEAIASYRAALRLRPDHAATHRDLASALAGSGAFAAAIGEYEAALSLEPGDATTHNGLATAYARVGQQEAAAREFEAALRLDPSYAEAHNNYGTLLASQGFLEDAIAQYELAVRLRPGYAEAQANLDLARREAAGSRH